LLTDVIMPGMNGRVLADLASQRQPGIRVLFMSGYTDDFLDQGDAIAGDAPILQKPFSPESLSAKIRQALDNNPSGQLSRLCANAGA
jgi:FixJ family two-component response regulator